MQIKFKDWPLNLPLIALTAVKILHGTACKVCPATGPEKKKLLATFSFLSSSNKQKTKHQSESNPATFWTPSPWKASLHQATLKTTVPFLPDSWLQSTSVKLQKIQVSIMHHMWLPYPSPYPWKTIQHSPWAG
jgi:hypothetical protein